MKFLVLALISAVITFSVQSLIFKKCSRTVFHFIPLMLIGCVYLVALGLFLSDLNQTGGVLMLTIYSIVLAGVNTVALIADLFAWLVEKV